MNEVKVDAKDVMRMLSDLKLTDKESKRAFKGGFRKAAGLIQRQARANLKGAQTKSGTFNASSLLRFIRVSVYKDGRGANVSALPLTQKQAGKMKRKGIKDKSFILRFFEGGTDERWTETKRRNGVVKGVIKTKNYRGRITKTEFFSKAVKSKQKEAEQNIHRFISEQIERIAKKRR